MPISAGFLLRLRPVLEALAGSYPTPFHIYDEAGIVATHKAIARAFPGHASRQYFAVKALPNPAILATLHREGSGLDCSSPTELELARRAGASGSSVVFTANNTSVQEYDEAIRMGAVVTFDNLSVFAAVRRIPQTVAFRVAPWLIDPARDGTLMGTRSRSKFGVPREDILDAYRSARERGAKSFGIHSMSLANELDVARFAVPAVQLVELAAQIRDQLGIPFAFINVGGGPGIPYRENDAPFDFERFAAILGQAVERCFPDDPKPAILTECGRFVTGPHGVLVTSVVSRAERGRVVLGVDASMSALMRPAMYPAAYHHITSPLAGERPPVMADVVGALCENNDMFGVQRMLPDPRLGDVLLIHDTGAHGHAMGFNYNGRLRPAELLLRPDGEVVEIRRAETFDDYVATVTYRPVRAGSPAQPDAVPASGAAR